MSFKNFLKNKPFFASIIVSIYRRKLIRIRIDSDGDFEIRCNGVSFFSASPFSWFDDKSKSLFEYDYICRSGDNAIIVGVEDGLELVHFCAICYPGLVVAIEPTVACLRRIKKLRDRNGLNNLIVEESAAGNRNEGAVEFAVNIGPNGDLSNSLLGFSKAADKDVTFVRMKRLDRVLADYRLDSISYLKINVEGSELLVLEGIGKSASQIKNICLSCHDFITPSIRTYDEALAWLNENSYVVRGPPFTLQRPWENFYLFGKIRGS